MSKVIVIGSGIAGLFSAIKLAEHDHEVHILTKQQPEDSSTNWAQGGIAAILDKTNRDGIEAHIHDTTTCGNVRVMKTSSVWLLKKQREFETC